MDRQELLDSLHRHLESGTLEPEVVLPVLRALGEEQQAPPSRWELLRALDGLEGPPFDRLRRAVIRALLQSVSLAREAVRRGEDLPAEALQDLGDLPVHAERGWHTAEASATEVTKIIRVYQELDFVKAQPEALPRIEKQLERLLDDHRKRSATSVPPWSLVSPTRLLSEAPQHESKASLTDWLGARNAQELEGLLKSPELETFADESSLLEALYERFQSSDREEQTRILDVVLAWPTVLAARVLPELCTEPWARDRASLILQMRFGSDWRTRQETWKWWRQWLAGLRTLLDGQRARVAELAAGYEPTLLRHWYACQPKTDAARQQALDDWSRATLDPLSAEEFLRRRGNLLTNEEIRAIESAAGIEPRPSKKPVAPVPAKQPGVSAPTPAPPVPDFAVVEKKTRPQAPAAKPEKKERIPTPPSFWTRHIQAFFAENWFMVAGILMVVVGASILAYFTWDKHWLIRYTIMPTLLGGFTFALAAMGRFLERQEEDLKNAAAMLRGAAILLLPINFMAVTFLWGDASVPGFVVPLMAAMYVLVFGWGLRRWCTAVHPALKWLAGGTLLFLNFLVFLRPLGETVFSVAEQPLQTVLGVGFHVGFLILAGAVLLFSERVLTAEMAAEKRVPWFFGLTLGVTFLQVFAWVHGLAGVLPDVYTYAPMLVLAGGLVLYLERKGLELRGESQVHEVESFLGFALVLLGIVMASGHDIARIVALLFAGAIWIHQAAKRDQDVHRWIGLTMLFLGGASVGMHASFPKEWLAAVGLVSAAAFLGASKWLLQRDPEDRTAVIAREMAAPILLLTALVAIVTQWTTASEPLWTAGALALISAWFIGRALVEQRVRWLFTAMVMLATALPYVGCVDLSGRTWHGNTMVFGLAVLSCLWIAVNAAYRTPLMRSARSSVLWTYGTLAVVGMVVRVLFEPVTPADAESMRVFMNYTGPLLMALTLGFATYTSRSIVPAFMAMTIVIILFPELKARFEDELQALGWGTGIGSAMNALWMTLVCFGLRSWSRLKALGEGDRFLGRYAFPLVRMDYKLFTWPLMVSALFLLLRTNTITYARNLPNVPLLTSLALCLAGVTWTAQAIYHHRERPGARVGTHLGWMSLLLGLAHWMPWPADWNEAQTYLFVLGAVLTGLYVLYRLPPIGKQPWAKPLLSSQIRWVLAGVAVVFSILWVPLLVEHGAAGLAPWFVLLLLALNAWQSIRTQWHLFGALLFFLCGAYVTTRFTESWAGYGALPDASLWYLVATQVALVGLSLWKQADAPLRAARQSVQVLSAAILLLLGVHAVLAGIIGFRPAYGLPGVLFAGFDFPSYGLLIAGLALAAWSTGSSAWVFVATLVGYLFVRQDWFSHWHADGVVVLAAALIGLSFAGRHLERTTPHLLRSRHAWKLPIAPIPWLPTPAIVLAIIAAAMHAGSASLRNHAEWTWIPYLSALTLSAAALRTRWHLNHGVALLVITIGNVFAVRALVGAQLTAWGLSDLHTVCLGLVVSLAELTALRLAIRSFRIRTYISRGCLALAGLVLLLLTANYLTHPDLGTIQWQRFLISGITAVLAGLYFRYVARAPDAGIKPYVRLCEGMYHYALAFAIGCFALLVPFLRTPATAMFALGMPALYFYARAELLYQVQRDVAERYRNSARVICVILLGLYVLRPVFQMVFFPSDPVQVGSYHWNAPLVMLLGLVMVRLRGLGASLWMSYFGGLALMIGSFFLLTWLPDLSPFSNPVPAAWCAVALAHFWMAVSSSKSPLRTAMQRVGALDDDQWTEARGSWGSFLLVALHAAAIWGLGNCEPSMPEAFAPLLAGVATVVFHQAFLRRNRWLHAIASIELLIALHADFFIESYITVAAVVWILLGLWAIALVAQARLGRSLNVRSLQAAATALFALCFGHALFHELWSATGLWVVGLATALANLTPQEHEQPENAWERLVSAVFVFLPVWLTYFALIGPNASIDTSIEPWAIGWATLVLVGIAAGLRWCAASLPPTVGLFTAGVPRLIDHTRATIMASGRRIGGRLVWVALGITVLLHMLHGVSELLVREHWMFMALYAAIAWEGWTALSKRRPATATVLLQLCGIGFLVSLRMLVADTSPDVWRAEYDVWAVLVLSMVLSGAKPYMDRSSSSVRRALFPGLFLLPAFAIVWTLANDLGTDVMLVVLGLQSLMFSYMGKDERESPYRIVAIAGFVAFVLVTFHSKLEFRQAHAYIIPVGLGVLALVQMLQRYMTVETRNRIRAATHITMLASAGYYALVDGSHTIAFNVTLFLLCLASMAAGALLRVRLFLLMGFGGLVVSLASIFYRLLKAMEHTMRLTSVGLLVLLVGVVFVMGTVYYKTHRDRVNAWLQRWQRKIGAWE